MRNFYINENLDPYFLGVCNIKDNYFHDIIIYLVEFVPYSLYFRIE